MAKPGMIVERPFSRTTWFWIPLLSGETKTTCAWKFYYPAPDSRPETGVIGLDETDHHAVSGFIQ
jgi:hypothetical protein